MSEWNVILTPEQIEERLIQTERLDPSFGRKVREFWETRTLEQLRALKSGAWLANDGDQYQMARSYIAMEEARRDEAAAADEAVRTNM